MTTLSIRPATWQDVKALDTIEQQCFDVDRLSARQIKHWVKANNRVFLVAEDEQGLIGYGLALLNKGTRLSRLYSLALLPRARGHGSARELMQQLEAEAAKKGRLFMRLEVANDNHAAIALYQKLGYQSFGTYADYYEDHRDAVRMQKRIRYIPHNLLQNAAPWFPQSTDFTCGPASLIMAMASLNRQLKPSLELELSIWREATTIYMTSGHGGCHPIGLALAASNRGFNAAAYINLTTPLFVEGVRNPHKKTVLTCVDKQFHKQAKSAGVRVYHREVTQSLIEKWLNRGAAVIILISTYRLDGKKTPHWVTVTGIDDMCLYVHDPDLSEDSQAQIDCQHIPIARDDFAKMSAFGSERLRTAVVIEKRTVEKNTVKQN